MKIKTYKTWKFSELDERQKEKAVEYLYDINIDHDWWEFIYEDAENVGLKIKGFDIGRGSDCDIEDVKSIPEIIENILSNHGATCDTYKTAEKNKPIFENLENARDEEYFDDEWDKAADEFLHDIAEDYLTILRKEYEYQTSKEAIIETIEANDYDFDENGRIA